MSVCRRKAKNVYAPGARPRSGRWRRLVACAMALFVVLAVPSGASATPIWTVVSMPQPRRAVTLSAVACATVQSCEAVGSDYPSGSRGVVHDVAEGWNGRRWRSQRVPAPAGRTTPELSGVSCASSRHCVAVGEAFVTYQLRVEAVIDVWNGKRWAAQPAAQPSATDTELDAVSCVSSRFCMSVGEEELPNPDALLVSEIWNGRSWKAIPVPVPAGRNGFDDLFAVSCTSPDACTAAGHDETPAPVGVDEPLIETWNGRRWHPTPLPRSPGRYGELNAVSCASATGCVAAGETFNRRGLETRPVVEIRRGRHWRLLAPPVPRGAQGEVDAVSCVSDDDCTAVGSAGGERTATLYGWLWNGASWSNARLPSPASFGRQYGPGGIACLPSGCSVVVNSQRGTFSEFSRRLPGVSRRRAGVRAIGAVGRG
jgi:hypothetical protein